MKRSVTRRGCEERAWNQLEAGIEAARTVLVPLYTSIPRPGRFEVICWGMAADGSSPSAASLDTKTSCGVKLLQA